MSLFNENDRKIWPKCLFRSRLIQSPTDPWILIFADSFEIVVLTLHKLIFMGTILGFLTRWLGGLLLSDDSFEVL